MVTYGQLVHRAYRLSGLLQEMEIEKGDRVCILLPNIPEFAALVIGAQLRGAVASPLNIRLSQKEMEVILEQVRPKVLISTGDSHPIIQNSALTSDFELLLLDSDMNKDALNNPPPKKSLESNPQPEDVYDRDPALLFFTSGTTGRPKGVMHSHFGVCQMLLSAVTNFQFSREDNFYSVLPPYYGFGMAFNVYLPLFLGSTVALTDKFSPNVFWNEVDNYKCTVFAGVPTMYSALLNTINPENSSLRLGICSGAPMSQVVLQEFSRRFNCSIIEAYGATEIFVSHMLEPGLSKGVGCIGKALKNPLLSAEIVDEAGRALLPYQVGELAIKSPSTMLGYYGDLEGTSRAIKNGLFYTGDEGYKDEDNYFYLIGRKQDMIKRGGERITPQEIENVLISNPKIAEAVVLGVSDSFWGEEIKAFIVARAGEIISKDEIVTFCKQNLAEYKCPKIIRFLDFIPKTATGKTSRWHLRGVE
jgi:long-chain acyl-CoA synthetase